MCLYKLRVAPSTVERLEYKPPRSVGVYDVRSGGELARGSIKADSRRTEGDEGGEASDSFGRVYLGLWRHIPLPPRAPMIIILAHQVIGSSVEWVPFYVFGFSTKTTT